MTFEALSDSLLGWLIRGAGLLWLVGAFMLFRQIRAEMALDSLTASVERIAGELETDRTAAWIDRDDATRRGWIAAQAVFLAAASVAMLMLHPFASWMAAALVLGQGAYFLWREHTARHAPTPEAAAHARPSRATVNAGWVSLGVALLVWLAAFRGLLG